MIFHVSILGKFQGVRYVNFRLWNNDTQWSVSGIKIAHAC